MRLPRLHKSSFLVAVLTTLVMCVIVVPGQEPHVNENSGLFVYCFIYTFEDQEHGWPEVFLNRRIDFYPDSEGKPAYIEDYPTSRIAGVPWLSWNAWKFWESSEYTFSLCALLFDALVLSLIVALATAFWEWRRRQRKRLFQVKLSEFLILFTVSSVCLGWTAYQRKHHLAEKPYLDAANELEPDVYVFETCTAPNWLVHLTGLDCLPEFLWRADEASIGLYGAPAPNEPFFQFAPIPKDEELEFLQPLKRLNTMEIDGDLQEDLNRVVAKLSELPQLRVLDVSAFDCEPPLGTDFAQAVTGLSRLRQLIVHSESDLTDPAWQVLRELMPNCEFVVLNEL